MRKTLETNGGPPQPLSTPLTGHSGTLPGCCQHHPRPVPAPSDRRRSRHETRKGKMRPGSGGRMNIRAATLAAVRGLALAVLSMVASLTLFILLVVWISLSLVIVGIFVTPPLVY